METTYGEINAQVYHITVIIAVVVIALIAIFVLLKLIVILNVRRELYKYEKFLDGYYKHNCKEVPLIIARVHEKLSHNYEKQCCSLVGKLFGFKPVLSNSKKEITNKENDK